MCLGSFISVNDWKNQATLVETPEMAKADVVVVCTAHSAVMDINWRKLRDTSELGIPYDVGES